MIAGAFCFGSDIDIRVLKGLMYSGASRDRGEETDRDKKRDVWENFKSYGLPFPELLRLDNHLLSRHLHLETDSEYIDVEMFDAILTDPPYSIRAGAKKSGKKGGVVYTVEEEMRENHYPATQNYGVEEVMLDLLHNAAVLLKVGATLSYLIPTTYDFCVEDLPEHPCFRIKYLCVQNLSSRHSRHLVVLEKTCKYSLEMNCRFSHYRERVKSGIDGGFSQLIKKLDAALSSDALFNESVVKHCNSRKVKMMEVLRKRVETGQDSREVQAPMPHIYNYKEISMRIAEHMCERNCPMTIDDICSWYLCAHGSEVLNRDVIVSNVRKMVGTLKVLVDDGSRIIVDRDRWAEVKAIWEVSMSNKRSRTIKGSAK